MPNMNQKIKFFFSLLTLLFLFACSKPDYELFEGTKGNKSDFLGKWLVVNYWADWCPPCIKEMPELESFYNKNENKALVLAYNFDRLDDSDLKDQILRFKVNVPSILTDPGLLFGWETPPSLPATYIINPEGKLVETLIGPQTRDSLEAIIKKYEN
tara:strand:+ start:331 stop:798 length:468 start_codon:yes stop_codon:yes gene_type:complete